MDTQFWSGTLSNVEMLQANNGNFYMTGALKVWQGNDDDVAWYDVRAFNTEKNRNLADKVSDCFGKGVTSVPCIIKGIMKQSTYEKDGQKRKSYQIIISEFAVSTVFGPVFIDSGDTKVANAASTSASSDLPFPEAGV